MPLDDIVIDPLAFAVGADPTSAQVAFETMCRVKQELGVNMVMGASNISFGMPDRGVINSAFVAIAIYSGLTSLIADTARIRPTVLAIDLLLEHDKHARRYVNDFRKRQGKQ
jgi:5-methyltetrahydrofolate--homocysteine methyltransferase